MLPIILDPRFLNVVVVGEGPATTRRLEMLESAGVKNVKYIKNIPSEAELENINLAYVADFDDAISQEIAGLIRAKKIPLNVEDKTYLCDFHAPAITRRGDLLITVSTGGKGPRLARRIKKIFEYMFDASWGDNLNELSVLREEYKKQGYHFDSMAKKMDEEFEKKDIFSKLCNNCRQSSKID